MRLTGVLLFCVVAATAGEDLTRREASGWAGFKKGTQVRYKRTVKHAGGAPRILTTTARLIEIGEKELKIELVNRQDGHEQRTEATLPRTGLAGSGEKVVKVEDLGVEVVKAAGQTFTCTKKRTTIRGSRTTKTERTGKDPREVKKTTEGTADRVITEWIADKPKVLVKSVEISTWPDNSPPLETEETLLVSLDDRRKVGEREIRCLLYKKEQIEGEVRTSQAELAYSRVVPGGVVWAKNEILEQGRVIATEIVRCESFDVK